MEDKEVRKKTRHELLGENAMEEEGREEEKNAKVRKETKDELQEEEIVERELGEDNDHSEDDLQGEDE